MRHDYSRLLPLDLQATSAPFQPKRGASSNRWSPKETFAPFHVPSHPSQFSSAPGSVSCVPASFIGDTGLELPNSFSQTQSPSAIFIPLNHYLIATTIHFPQFPRFHLLQAAFAVFLRVSSEAPADARSSSAFHSAFSSQSSSTLVLHSAVLSQVPSGLNLECMFCILHLFLYNRFHQMTRGCSIARSYRILMLCSIA
ncbi:unnamed protein product [Victoria cruziana]